MKTALCLGLVVLSLASARAQVFRPEAINGAVLGAAAGAVIGNNSGDLRHNAWKGAAIGAGVGLVAGQAIGDSRGVAAPVAVSGSYVVRDRGYGNRGYRSGTTTSISIGYGRGYNDYYSGGYRGYSGGYRNYGYYDRGWRGSYYRGGYWGPSYTYSSTYYPSYSYVPSYGYYDGYGAGYPYYGTTNYGTFGGMSAAGNGLVLGAIAGGIIGHNSGDLRHNGWRGAAIGAGLGWLLGTVVDNNRRAAAAYETQPTVVQAPAPTVSAVAAQPVAAPAPVAPVRAPSAMSSANTLFGRN